MTKILLLLALLHCLPHDALADENISGFPIDFPLLKDHGGLGKGSVITGFGGRRDWDSAKHKVNIKHTPVILLHGNGSNALSDDWGMVALRAWLIKNGYSPAEVWGLSYLGNGNKKADMPKPHTGNIRDVRAFVDAVIDYTGAKRVDLIGHSLGGNLARCYLLGLNEDGLLESGLQRYAKVRTLVTLASAHHGLGMLAPGEFQTGSDFEKRLHVIAETEDESPYGPSKLSHQQGKYLHISRLDNDQITYVALWAKGDFIDIQNPGTGRLQGANLNKGYDLGPSLIGHKRIIHDEKVFEDILPFIKKRDR